MLYTETRNDKVRITAQEAILRGLGEDGGLYLPVEIPTLTAADLARLMPMSYAERAAAIMKLYLDDFSEAELLDITRAAYAPFGAHPAPLVSVDGNLYLELWHGPTSAFKDMALQILPRLLVSSAQKLGVTERVLILTATSGDTGKAALEGFKDVEGTSICVFYPDGGTSEIQRLQMAAQEGSNVFVQAVEGNFDDTQTGVKRIFADAEVQAEARRRGVLLSSANSINWGRLLPQIVYYVSAYLDAVANGTLSMGEKLNFCVPTGNFGNILAAYYAREMGLPIGRLICASNDNNVLTDFFHTGTYSKNRPFYRTTSPSMDILVSSNLERLLYLVVNGNAFTDDSSAKVKTFTDSLSSSGRYSVDEALNAALSTVFFAGWASELEVADTIKRVWTEHHYLLDPHTAVAEDVKVKYFTATGDDTPTVVVSTASPYKFCDAVLPSLGVNSEELQGFELLDKLHAFTGIKPPKSLTDLRDKAERFTGAIHSDVMRQVVLDRIM